MVIEYLLNKLFPERKRKTVEDMFQTLYIDKPEDLREDIFRTGLDVLHKAGTALTLASPPTTAKSIGGTIAKGGALDKLEKLIMDKSFKYYGNWGGPNYSSGRHFRNNENLTLEDIDRSSIDALDELYKRHDLEYIVASSHTDKKTRGLKTKYADERFIRDAEKLLDERTDLSFTQRALAKASILAFKTKTALGSYDIDYMDNPEITEKSKKYLGFINNDYSGPWKGPAQKLITMNDQEIQPEEKILNKKVSIFDKITPEKRKILIDILTENDDEEEEEEDEDEIY